MKKIFLLSLMVVFVFTSTSLYAAEKYALGNSNIALKVDWINFTEDVFGEFDLKDGIYLGLEGYYGIAPNLYLGIEAGWADTSNDEDDVQIGGNSYDIETDIFLVPIELNLKYAIDVAPNWVFGIGAGVSYSWLDVDVEVGDKDADIDDWVFGGQVFADITYKLSNQWFIGIDGKYQFTDDLEFEVKGEDIETNASANNWRVGAHIGLMF